MQALYSIDKDAPVRYAHDNEYLKKLYDEFLGEPLSERSHELLHTTYGRRQAEY